MDAKALAAREREARVENGRIVEREKENRDVLLADFKGSIEGIQKSIEGHGAREKLLLDENEALREKLQNFGEQVKLREDHLAKFEEAKGLEIELLEVKLKQQEGLVDLVIARGSTAFVHHVMATSKVPVVWLFAA